MKKNSYDIGDRVIVNKTLSGEIINDTTCLHLTKHYDVNLDTGEIINIDAFYLELEYLTQKDINTKINNLLDEIKKQTFQFQDDMGKKLPEHLNLLKKAVESKDKMNFDSESQYILSKLKIAFKTKSITEEFLKTAELTIKQLKQTVKIAEVVV